MSSLLRMFLTLSVFALVPACNGTLDPNQSSSSNAPSFGGATSAAPGANPGEVTLSWSSPALSVAGGTITYLVYASGPGTGSGTENMSTPIASTTSSTGITVSGLTSLDPYWFIVQAADSGGQEGNMNEVTASAK